MPSWLPILLYLKEPIDPLRLLDAVSQHLELPRIQLVHSSVDHATHRLFGPSLFPHPVDLPARRDLVVRHVRQLILQQSTVVPNQPLRRVDVCNDKTADFVRAVPFPRFLPSHDAPVVLCHFVRRAAISRPIHHVSLSP